MRISENENEIAFNEHVTYEWVNCDDKQEVYAVCFESYGWTMKLPHNALNGEPWRQDGGVLTARRHPNVQLFGSDVGDIYSVTIVGQEKRGYVYSPEKGVIAIFDSGPDSFGMVLISGECGYGAPSACYED